MESDDRFGRRFLPTVPFLQSPPPFGDPIGNDDQSDPERVRRRIGDHESEKIAEDRIDDPDAHSEHKGVRHGEIAPEDVVTDKIRKIPLVVLVMGAEHNHRVTNDHGDDRHDLQEVEFYEALAASFRFDFFYSVSVI